MGTHYITCAPIAVLGGFLIAFALESSGTAVVWLTFAFAFGIVALAARFSNGMAVETLPLSPGSHPYCVGPHANGADARWRG